MNTRITRIVLSISLVMIISTLSCIHPIDKETTTLSGTKVPEIEMVHIVFSLNWIQNNDVASDPYRKNNIPFVL
jgi:hypothetical protein